MRRLLFALLLTASAALLAVPVNRQWTSVRLTDGTLLDVMPAGDEWHHYYQDAEGRFLLPDGQGLFRYADSLPQHHARRQQAAMARHRQARQHRTAYYGERRGLIILVSFTDRDFKSDNPKQEWTRIANERGYHEGEAYGSVSDYFMAQSGGLFDLQFDVVGPVPMDTTYGYYGRNDRYGDDANVGELIYTACTAVADSVDFADYDWNGDGEAEQVYIIYAGFGEHDSHASNLIWPHQWFMEFWPGYENLVVDGVRVNSYACSSELRAGGSLAGMGTICHEFSHCLGLPDMYDTEGGGSVLGRWDLMDNGNYNGNGWRPAGYSAYERYFCGWLEPEVLATPQLVEALPALGDGGQAYMIVNECDDPAVDEYYLLENRQQSGWDAQLPGHGLLVTHVDYDSTAWADNTPNAKSSHLRIAYIPAAGARTSRGAAYPYNGNDSLTDDSSPAAEVFHVNQQGTRLMGKPLRHIAEADGLVWFSFMTGETSGISAVPRRPSPLGRTLYDLQGRPVGMPSRGIYISNGRKVMR